MIDYKCDSLFCINLDTWFSIDLMIDTYKGSLDFQYGLKMYVYKWKHPSLYKSVLRLYQSLFKIRWTNHYQVALDVEF